MVEKRAYCLNPWMLRFNPCKYKDPPFPSTLTLGGAYKPSLTGSIPCNMNLREKMDGTKSTLVCKILRLHHLLIQALSFFTDDSVYLPSISPGKMLQSGFSTGGNSIAIFFTKPYAVLNGTKVVLTAEAPNFTYC